MRLTGSFARIAAIAVFALFLSATVAMAASAVDVAKQQGLVGEQPDGLLGAVGAASPDIALLVNQTNAERIVKYQSIAQKNGTALPQVQALAGKKLIEKAMPGEFIKNASGSWQKK
jgi:uncharacterized protein YdbL (DUF1318 family)